ncbi:MAG TPA: hypothetical protein VNV62_09485 [Trebonia sp.]|nr:hypothetical protein [Trebonia sp.]
MQQFPVFHNKHHAVGVDLYLYLDLAERQRHGDLEPQGDRHRERRLRVVA